MKNKNALYGILFILVAVCLVVNKLDLIPHIPVTKIILTCVFIYMLIQGIRKMEFMMIFLPLALIGWQYDDWLGIESLTPWTLIIVAILLAIGCELMFQNKKYRFKRWSYQKNHPNYNFEFNSDGISSEKNACPKEDFQSVMKEDGEYFWIENGFGESSRYIDSSHFRFAEINNGFGKCMVYFNNCVVSESATICVNNGMGKADLYIPANWRVELHTENGLGNISVQGEPSKNPDDPMIRIDVSNGLGQVVVKFI